MDSVDKIIDGYKEDCLDVKGTYSNKLCRVLNDEQYDNIEVIKRGFLCVEKIPYNSILFIGINPSFIEARETAIIRNLIFYKFSDAIKGYPRYYNPFQKLTKDLTDIRIGHMDLLYHRETKQEKINSILRNEPNGVKFICEQLHISKQILESVSPKIIVVANAKASYFMGKNQRNGKDIWLGYTFKFDDNIGTHRIDTDGALKNVPVLFSSMLSGQRALDTGSFERLQWHIKFILDKLNNSSITT